MVSARNPLYAKLTMFASLNYLLSCYQVRPNKPLRVIQQVMNHKSVWGFFDIFTGCWENLFADDKSRNSKSALAACSMLITFRFQQEVTCFVFQCKALLHAVC